MTGLSDSERFSLFGLDTYGYGNQVVFLCCCVDPQPLYLDTGIDALVCSDICVPFAGPLSNVPAALSVRLLKRRPLHRPHHWFACATG